MDSEVVRRRVVIRGRVQGVFFRDSTRERAVALSLGGWVRNCSDGSVEAVLEGPANAVEQMLPFLQDGPPRASVREVDVRVEPPEGLRGFEVR
jgi:acylphosphatase